MRWLHRLAAVLRGWFTSSALDRQLDEELQFHFDREVQQNLARGLTPAQARRAAALTIGNPASIHEASRDERPGAGVRQFGRDAIYGLRLLRRSPGFSLAAISIIALGIGSVTAIFSVVYAVALKPLPFREPGRLVNIWSTSSSLGPARYLVNGADHRDWQAGNHVFEDIAIYRNVASFNLVGDGEPERLLAARISSNLLPLLGVSPAIGRGFTEDEDEVGHENVVLLSDTLWRQRFNGDPTIVGRTINLNGAPHVVVGVMGPHFQFPGREFQIWTPLTINPAELARQAPGNNHQAIARLKPGVSLAEAQADMRAVAGRIAAANPGRDLDGVVVVPTQADLLANVRGALFVILGAVCCLLLIAALNLSTLLAARGAARSRELAVRLALGATRSRVVLQTIAELVPLLLAGGALGIAIAVYAVSIFVPLAPPTLPRVEEIHVSSEVLIASIVILGVTGIIAALLPAAQAWRADLTRASREDARTMTGSARLARLRSALVVMQITLALPLLIGGALLTRTFVTLAAASPGFVSDHVLSLNMAMPRTKYRSDPAVADFVTRVHERVRQIPGVDAAGLVNRLPLGGGAQLMMLNFDAPRQVHPYLGTIDSRVVTPGYFRTLGIPVIEGRDFTGGDADGAAPVGIVDQRVAQLMWPGESAVGKRFRFAPQLVAGQPNPWFEIIGVVGHIKHDGIDVDPHAQVYWNYLQRAQDRMSLVVRAPQGSAGLTSAVVAAIHDVDPDQPVFDVRSMDDVVQRSLSQRWMNMTLVAGFAVVALVLCSIGVYGVIAFGVTQQRREFGIRLALGASRATIASSVMARGLLVAATGVGAGLLLAGLLASGMASVLFGVQPRDALTFAASAALVLVVALLASYLPARRAAAVDPAATLRGD